MSGWVRNYPELGEAHRLKEDFFSIYEAQSKDEAQGRYIAWKRGMSQESAVAFGDLMRAWDNWTPWVLGYFEHPVTSAYTESLNNLIGVMNRLGRGYSFEALRAKILFSEGAHKIVKPRQKFERRAANERDFIGYALFTPSTQKEAPGKNYGADISILARMIEAGDL